MSEFSYLWYRFILQVACDKCGNNIAQQEMDRLIRCDDCGDVSSQHWGSAMEFCGIAELLQAKTGSKHLTGLMTATSSSNAVAEINCHHCRKIVQPAGNLMVEGEYTCENCSKKIAFKPIALDKHLVFYRFVNRDKIDPDSVSTIAVRCASCGAPMDVDPYKTNYPCTFCNVQNILPPALRQKRVLDDIFIGVQKKNLSLTEMMESADPYLVMNALQNHHASAFKAEALNAAMLKFSESEAIFNLMVYKIGHKFPKEVLEKIWESSTIPAVINQSGKELGKSKQEIARQHNRFTPEATGSNETVGNSLFDRIKSLFKS